MRQRRAFVSGIFRAGITAAVIGIIPSVWAQRPAHPIARPPRPGQPRLPGRFNPDDGVASGPRPGVYVVVVVDKGADTLHLRDGSGRTDVVRVDEDIFDVESVNPGDEVEVDFLVPESGGTRLEAAGVWKVQR